MRRDPFGEWIATARHQVLIRPLDRTHDYSPSGVVPILSGAALGRKDVRNQIAVAIDSFAETLGAGFAELNRVHPKGVLISGMLSELDQRERDSFNFFRQGLFSMTVITYDEVLHRLKLLFDRGSVAREDADGADGLPGNEPDESDEIPW